MAGHSCILTYHSLDDSGSVISTPPATFARQMKYLAGSGRPVVALSDSLLRPGSVAITFDDGFGNLAHHAFPLLERYGFPATIFVVSRYCGGRNNWRTQPKGGVPDLPLLTWSELGRRPAQITVGVHTVTHPFLTQLSPQDCENEMVVCRDEIEQRLGVPVRSLAYPYGDLSPRVRTIAESYFDVAVGTSLDFLPMAPDPLNLPRLDTYYLRDVFPLEKLFGPAGPAYIRLRRNLRHLRTLVRR